MPSQQALEDAVRSFLAEENKAQSGDWSFLWDKVADPDRFVFADDLGNVFLGRAEASAEFESWGRLGSMKNQIVSAIEAYPGALGPLSLIETTVKYTSDKPAEPGLDKETTHRMFMLFDDNCKLVRLQTWPADEQTTKWAANLLKARETSKGVAKGGYKSALEMFEKGRLATEGGIEEVRKAISDDAVYVDSAGGVYFRKDAVCKVMSTWYDLGLSKMIVNGQVHTPEENKAWALVNTVFNLPYGAPGKDHKFPPMYIRLESDPKTGLIKRAFTLQVTSEGYAETRSLLEWRMEGRVGAGVGAA